MVDQYAAHIAQNFRVVLMYVTVGINLAICKKENPLQRVQKNKTNNYIITQTLRNSK